MTTASAEAAQDWAEVWMVVLALVLVMAVVWWLQEVAARRDLRRINGEAKGWPEGYTMEECLKGEDPYNYEEDGL